MKKLYIALIGFFLLLFHSPASASVLVAGADMSYAYLGNYRYEVKLNIYTDCYGDALSQVRIKVASPDASFTPMYVDATVTDQGDVTSECYHEDVHGHSHVTACEDTSSAILGIRKYEAVAIVRLLNSGICEYVFSWESCCRTGRITTGGGGQGFYIDAFLRNCGNPAVSSPEFSQKPYFFAASNKCTYKENPVNDVVSGQAPTYNFRLVAPRQNDSEAVVFDSPYSFREPLNYTGFGDPDLPWDSINCKGFHLDEATGTLFFKPQKAAHTIVAVMLEKSVNGAIVSRITRDVSYIIQEHPENRNPVITGFNGTSKITRDLDAGDGFCAWFKAFDLDRDDSVKVTGYFPEAGATLTVQNGRHPKLTFCWTPEHKHMRDEPYILYIFAEDDKPNCEDFTSGRAMKMFYFYVHLHYVSISETPENAVPALYPNPSTGDFTVAIPPVQVNGVEMTDALGRSVPFGYSREEHGVVITTASLLPGTYIVSFTTPEAVMHLKVMIR
ncbi:MAG: T9SS type A sorting domain-containing protein [Bacteroidota bacterium]|nr:T9SS type A sorting domain-containing protein [Bacteroidota bacterium]